MTSKKHVKAPLIGISATLLMVESGSFIGRERTAVVHDYIQAVQQAGGVPLVLPIIEGKELVHQQMECVDGLLLSGGYDVCPLLYGEEPMYGLETVCLERDAYELELVKEALRLKKPIFGICRGLQLLNVAFGGTLYQDIRFALPSALQHNQKAKPEDVTHSVTILPETHLHQIMQESSLLTNSFHHQTIKNLAPGLTVNAQTIDGVIEGIEGQEDLFVLGVQWHPELMIGKHPEMLKLFQAFIDASSQKRTP